MSNFSPVLFAAFGAITACVPAKPRTTAPSHVVEVAFQSPRNQVLVKARVNGRGPLTFSLDTGTDPSVVDLSTAKEIGLSLDTISRKGQGVGENQIIAFRSDLRALDMGLGSKADVVAVALDLSGPAKRLGVPLHGVLGYSFLADKALQIDYARKVVRFFVTGSPLDEPSQPGYRRVVLPLGIEDQQSMPVVPMTIRGRPGNLLLDTGSNLELSLVPDAIQHFGLEADMAHARVDSVVGYGGRELIQQLWVHDLKTAGIPLDSADATIRRRDLGKDAAARSGTIGNGLLRRYKLSLDYRRGLMALDFPQ